MKIVAHFLISLIAICMGAVGSLAQEPLQVIYPLDEGDRVRVDYQVGLLRLALEKSGREFHLKESPILMNQERATIKLEKGEGISVLWTGTSKDRESRLWPIRIPLMRGLLGHRVFIIRRDRQAHFDRVRDLKDLSELIAVQGAVWPDTQTLQQAGLTVVTGKYQSLFKLIQIGRGDYFPRGVNEPYAEIEARQEVMPDLTVEKGIVLIYKFDFFYFVQRGNRRLHSAIKDGLLRMYEDGSFLDYFNNHPDIVNVMTRSNLAQRRAFFLKNPHLTDQTASIPDKFWHTVEAGGS